ncbi:HAD family hydrolase [Anaerolineales bacterium HSG6]|nr:HAD family hydrolase [Anaerolineales bacterium HSG6]
MITTILLDLDNTLIGNDMNDFLPPYFAGLASYLGNRLGDKSLPHMLSQGVQLITNDTSSADNYTLFMDNFAEQIGYPVTELQPLLIQFYAETFPTLQQYTSFRPSAHPLIEQLLADGYKVVIATNPVFPQTAIEQRLEWAGIADFPYPLVTTMENSFSCKPQLVYYEAILETVNSQPHECWMVGDNLSHDIEPAHTLGCKTWWIPNGRAEENSPSYDQHGELVDLLRFVQAKKL